MKLYLSMLVLLLTQQTFAQIWPQTHPANKQVFQRNSADSASVTVAGVMHTNGAASVTLNVYKDNVAYFSQTYTPQANSGLNNFSFVVKIKAGLFNYKFDVIKDLQYIDYSYNNVACGDVFVFYGQSNSIGLGADIDSYVPPADPFMRYLHVHDLGTMSSQWLNVGYQSAYATGVFPLEIMRAYRQVANYPVGIIQGAYSGAGLSSLNVRNAADPLDGNTRYGELMRKITMAGIKNNVKYLIFRQGENEGSYAYSTGLYPGLFQTLIDNFALDIPSLTHFFNFQLNVMSTRYSNNPDMEVLRDFQRRTETIYPIVRSVASVGIDTGFDGVHYTTPGHFKAAKSIAGILQKEVLGTSNSANVYSPNVKKIFYNADKTQIILKFNQGIDMIYPTDSTFLDINGFPVTSSMKNEIFINGVPSVVQSGSASKNYVFLNIPQSTSNQQITYIRNLDPISYTGVHLKTTLGERALTFARQTVVDGLSSPNASALLAMATSVSLQWSAVPQASFYHIERRTTGQPFIEVGTATNLTYLDQNLISNQTYDYRIWAENLSSESGVSNIASVSTTCNDNISVLSGGISANLIASNTVVLATQTQASNLNVAAGLSVTLLPGFSTQTGGTFVSEIRNCTN